MDDHRLIADIKSSKREAERRFLIITSIAVAAVLLIVGSITFTGWKAFRTLEANQETIKESQVTISEVAKRARREARNNYCNTLEHRINSRGSDRLTIGLIKSIVIANTVNTPNTTLGRYIRGVELPPPPHPRLINRYHSRCEGGQFYEPKLGTLEHFVKDVKGDARKAGDNGTTSAPRSSGAPTVTTRTEPVVKSRNNVEPAPDTPGKSNPKGKALGHEKQKEKGKP